MHPNSRPQLDTSPARYAQRLAIIVPYRDRAEHFGKFVAHLLEYFSQDKLDRQIDYQLHFVEQVDKKAFNRGALKNAGAKLALANADYLCFHDIDYLPIWADYSYAQRPARLIWHGLEGSATDTRRAQGAPTRESFFGGVVMFSAADFKAVNGYPNCYWGWGAEDTELRMRCSIAKLNIEHRDGTYRALPHEHHGFKPGTLDFNDAARTNHQLMQRRLPRPPQTHAARRPQLRPIQTQELRTLNSRHQNPNAHSRAPRRTLKPRAHHADPREPGA